MPGPQIFAGGLGGGGFAGGIRGLASQGAAAPQAPVDPEANELATLLETYPTIEDPARRQQMLDRIKFLSDKKRGIETEVKEQTFASKVAQVAQPVQEDLVRVQPVTAVQPGVVQPGVQPGVQQAELEERQARGQFRAQQIEQGTAVSAISPEQQEASDFEEMNAFYEEEDRLVQETLDKVETMDETTKAKFLSAKERKMVFGMGLQQMGLGLSQWQQSIKSLDPQESLGAMTTFLSGYMQVATAGGRHGAIWGQWGPAIGILGTMLNIRGQRASRRRQADYQKDLVSEVSLALTNSRGF